MCYTFWQLPLDGRSSSCSSRGLGLFGANGGASAGVATHHWHSIVITTSLQGVPVGDEGEPAVLSLQCHLERHKALQVHVTEKKWEVTKKRWTNSCIHSYRVETLNTKPGAHSSWRVKKNKTKHKSTTHTSETPVAPVVTNTCCTEKLKPPSNQLSRKNLHSPLVLSHKLGGELAEDVQESQVEGRASFSLGTRLLKCKLDTIPESCTETEWGVTDCEQRKKWFYGHKTKIVNFGWWKKFNSKILWKLKVNLQANCRKAHIYIHTGKAVNVVMQ